MDERLVRFLEGPVMLVAASADRAGRPAIARVMGVRLQAQTIDLFVSRARWSQALEALGPGAWLALILCRPATYETYQVKGSVESLEAAAAEDLAWAEAYMGRTAAHLAELGVEPGQIRPWLSAEDLVRVRLRPVRLFDQTPGPAAGRPLEPAP